MENNKFTIAIDFDGTIVEDKYPKIGNMIFEAEKYINLLYYQGCNIIINSCRTGLFQGDMQMYLIKNNIAYSYINCNLPNKIEKHGEDCRKISADVYIDDKCLMGLPKTWKEIYDILQNKIKKYEKV